MSCLGTPLATNLSAIAAAFLLHSDFIINNINVNYTAINARTAVPATQVKGIGE